MHKNIIIEDGQSIRITKVTELIYNRLKDFMLNEDPTIWEVVKAADFIVRVYQNGIKYDSLPVLFYSAAFGQLPRLRERATISATVDDVDEEYDLQDFAEEVKLHAQEIVVLYELSSLPRSEGIALTINANHNWGRFEYTGKEDVYELLDCVRKVIDQLEYDARNYSHY